MRESPVTAPPGCALPWSGQYEAMARVRERLPVVIPVTRFLVVVLLYLSTQSFAKTAVVCCVVPFSVVGAGWFLYPLGDNMSIAVWVGIIALVGLDAETGQFVQSYLDLANEKAPREVIVEGAVRRR